MNVVSILFPSATALCVWHANKAVFARYQPAFNAIKEWKDFYGCWFFILASPTEKTYDKRLHAFETKYGPTNPQQIGYIKETWLLPYKEKLVAVWVDQNTHFGNTATSCVEGIHALLKLYLRRSTFDLFEA